MNAMRVKELIFKIIKNWWVDLSNRIQNQIYLLHWVVYHNLTMS